VKNLKSVIIQFIVPWGYYPFCVKNKIVAEILV